MPASAVLGLTMGDPAGIGPDITLQAWHHLVHDRASCASPVFVVYANVGMLAARAHSLRLNVPITVVDDPSQAATLFPRSLPVIDIALAAPCIGGAPDGANAEATLSSITRAVTDVARGATAAIVTNPIAKSVLYRAGFPHPGHTEFLGELSRQHWPAHNVVPVMLLASDMLRVVPLTIHVALERVPSLINADLIFATARTLEAALSRDFAISQPRIAVAGLNPHAGEGGSLGREDVDVIAPAIARLQAAGLAISGPHSADTLFHAAARRTYDAVIAMYHDQALIPIKTLSFDTGVNVTLGLPFVRTSPDHGTAFDIAGVGTASPQSLLAALHLAADMASKRVAMMHEATP
ncbi:MAG: 4-hydroxythreonine-4-phosphate dehydrogenase PdxA [Hyphomicrobium sp.]|nr:4-hydroxythreonine-4-phosphate dehydrogenase PdxA [Hyphomicrobium sp.]